MRREADAHDRDPDAIEVTWSADLAANDDPVAAAEQLAEKGVSRVVVPSFMFLRNTANALAEFGETFVAPLADM
ncbi:MAG: pyridoxal/pyridoxine/pyridoxamine kinase [Acidimicrobiales bacterium]|jgi:pyridoxal/pyridoxine/pyridoxamine kinase